MTQRERQILCWIQENPMISQEDLAKKAGISRSSVAVHISNLMKKGYIAGKGYVFRSGNYVTVVGGINIDIGGQAYSPLIDRDSNPGYSTTSLGGVGRNIAHNLSLLDLDVRFLTAFGDDSYAERIEASCGNLGIDISKAKKIPGARSSTYIYLNDNNGDMALAVSDMEICEEITPEYLAKNISVVNNAQLVVLDTNIPEESIMFLTENATPPIFADPVSVSKAARLKPYLSKIHTIKPNKLEAELLSDVEITDRNSLIKAADVLLAKGVHRVFISLGEEGLFAADREKHLIIPCIPAEIVSTTGAGDAFMAGLVLAYMKGRNLEDTCAIAAAAASIAVESRETINPAMSPELIETRISKLKR